MAITSSTNYLGTKLCLQPGSTAESELDHRIATAWAKFGTFRHELTNKKTNLYDRLRLFEAVVTPCALYASGSWSLKRQDEQKLNVAQRRMLRAILGKGRRRVEQEDTSTSPDVSSDGTHSDLSSDDEGQLESWTDWLHRTTAEVRTSLSKLRIDEWGAAARKRQWKWASSVVQHSAERWTARILHWQPSEGVRQVGRPRLRWIDPIQSFAQHWTGLTDDNDSWMYLLGNASQAHAALGDYVSFCSGAAGRENC